MKKNILFILSLVLSTIAFSQTGDEAKELLDEVSKKMGAYDNMHIDFSTSLVNIEAGIKEGDELPINGKITVQKEKYYLEYLGNTLIYDGKKLYVINNDEKEVSINDGDLQDEEGFIYPSKMLTFYKEGYTFKMGEIRNHKGRMIQNVELFPIDSKSEIEKVILGVDKASKHIYQLIQQGSNGAVTTLTINQLRSNQELSPTLFTFNRKKYEKLNFYID